MQLTPALPTTTDQPSTVPTKPVRASSWARRVVGSSPLTGVDVALLRRSERVGELDRHRSGDGGASELHAPTIRLQPTWTLTI